MGAVAGAALVVLFWNVFLAGHIAQLRTVPRPLALFVVQALYALVRRLVSPLLAWPILAYNLVLALAAVARYALSLGYTPPDPLLAVAAALGEVSAGRICAPGADDDGLGTAVVRSVGANGHRSLATVVTATAPAAR